MFQRCISPVDCGHEAPRKNPFSLDFGVTERFQELPGRVRGMVRTEGTGADHLPPGSGGSRLHDSKPHSGFKENGGGVGRLRPTLVHTVWSRALTQQNLSPGPPQSTSGQGTWRAPALLALAPMSLAPPSLADLEVSGLAGWNLAGAGGGCVPGAQWPPGLYF